MSWDSAAPTAEELKDASASSGSAWAAAAPTPEELKTVGKGESFLRGAGNNFPLAPQVAAEGGAMADAFKGKSTSEKVSTALKALMSGHLETPEGAYSEHLADWKTKAAAAKAANPKTYGAGAVAGTLAPLAIPGVGEAMEAAPMLGNAALGAVSAIGDTDLSKDPKKAALDAIIGGGLGAATAGLVKGLTPEASSIEGLANKTAVKSLGLPSGEVGSMEPAEREALGEFARSNGLVGVDKEAILEHARGLSDQFGQQIGDIAKKSEGLGLTADKDAFYNATVGLQEKGAQYADLMNPEGRALARNYNAGAQDIRNLSDDFKKMPSWGDIQQLKEQYGKLAFKSTGEVKNEAAKDTYFALKDLLNSIAEKAKDNPELPGAYKDALAGYSKMHPIVTGLEKSVDAELRGGAAHGHSLVSALRSVPGPARAVIGTGAALLGHPHVALAAAIPEALNPAVQTKALEGAAEALPAMRAGASRLISERLDNIVKTRPELLGTHAPVLQAAAARGPNALATTHYILQQQDPAYRAKIQKLQESEGNQP